jgi:hypothetical protein
MDRDQAIAIDIREAGASNAESPKEKKSALRHTQLRERKGRPPASATKAAARPSTSSTNAPASATSPAAPV